MSHVFLAAPKDFNQLPISAKTKEGLAKAGYSAMKDIQRAAIGHILAGRDLLGAAKTGSGKTLAFLIPTMEKLYRLQWSRCNLWLQSSLHLIWQIWLMWQTAWMALELSSSLQLASLPCKFSKFCAKLVWNMICQLVSSSAVKTWQKSRYDLPATMPL